MEFLLSEDFDPLGQKILNIAFKNKGGDCYGDIHAVFNISFCWVHRNVFGNSQDLFYRKGEEF